MFFTIRLILRRVLQPAEEETLRKRRVGVIAILLIIAGIILLNYNFFISVPLYKLKFKVVKFLRLAVLLAVPVLALMLSDCKKDSVADQLAFSTDTLTFDTVFTSVGSTTKYFKVFNTGKSAVTISDIHLAHLVGTQFRIRVDGLPIGDHVSNVEVPGRDSIYVFVEVTVNPNDQSTPFVIIDDVQFTFKDKMQTVHLQAFGQNAHFHYGKEIKTGETEVWQNDLPHVIVGNDSVPGVLVDCGGTLKINPGCKVYFTGNSGIFVLGTLEAKATTWSDSISFEGARLEHYYDNKPGQWFGLVFLRNKTCVPHGTFDHCVITESSYGIYAGAGLDTGYSNYLGSNGRPVVKMDNTIVKNSLYNAVFGFNADISATNSLFYTAGEYLLKFGLGGNYNFNYCTIYNGGSPYVDHQKETLLLSNFLLDGNQPYREPLTTNFSNSVIYGNLDNEISFNNYDRLSLANFDNKFSYTLLKANADTVGIFSTLNDNNIFNKDPRFFVFEGRDFTPISDSTGHSSPLLDIIPKERGIGKDLYDVLRPATTTLNTNKYDIGAVEATR